MSLAEIIFCKIFRMYRYERCYTAIKIYTSENDSAKLVQIVFVFKSIYYTDCIISYYCYKTFYFIIAFFARTINMESVNVHVSKFHFFTYITNKMKVVKIIFLVRLSLV